MNKVLVLREKYPKISQKIFDGFVDADKTPTKKYLAYMLKLWSTKKSNSMTAERLSKYVSEFDELLPYIDNKDIYSSSYDGYGMLVNTVEIAKELREEKTFVREEHVIILLETDDYLFLSPKTYRGSLKYGYGTKWCTASKTSPQYFNNYTDNGCLCYLIDKRGDKTNNMSKVAFFYEKLDENSLVRGFSLYNQQDSIVHITQLYNSNWTENDLFYITTYFRKFCCDQYKIKKAKTQIKSTISSIRKIDLDLFMSNIKFIENLEHVDNSPEKTVINEFLNKLKNINL